MTEEHKIENSDGLTVGIIKNLQDAQGVMEIQIGVATHILWGVGPITPEMLPVQNAPAGEQRIVLGNKMAATLYVKTETVEPFPTCSFACSANQFRPRTRRHPRHNQR